jgi:uncharacterized protein (DUF433 family)
MSYFDAIRELVASSEFIVADPDRAGGKPTLKGSRFTVASLLAELADGDRSLNALIEDFDLDEVPARGFLRELSRWMNESFDPSTERTVHYISGHLDLTEDEFEEHYRPKIDDAIARGDRFVVGDAPGADRMAQLYLHGKTHRVMVYHMKTSPRNNVGFHTVSGFESDTERDEQMTYNSTTDIAWVRPGREDSGTRRNLDRRIEWRRAYFGGQP